MSKERPIPRICYGKTGTQGGGVGVTVTARSSAAEEGNASLSLDAGKCRVCGGRYSLITMPACVSKHTAALTAGCRSGNI